MWVFIFVSSYEITGRYYYYVPELQIVDPAALGGVMNYIILVLWKNWALERDESTSRGQSEVSRQDDEMMSG